jgi:hypothetical protein
MWENIAPMVERSRFPILNDHDLALLLERARPDFEEVEEPKLEFPNGEIATFYVYLSSVEFVF